MQAPGRMAGGHPNGSAPPAGDLQACAGRLAHVATEVLLVAAHRRVPAGTRVSPACVGMSWPRCLPPVCRALRPRLKFERASVVRAGECTTGSVALATDPVVTPLEQPAEAGLGQKQPLPVVQGTYPTPISYVVRDRGEFPRLTVVSRKRGRSWKQCC